MWASLFVVSALVLQPAARVTRTVRPVVGRAVVRAQSIFSSDGGDSGVDWDKEAAALATTGQNNFYQTIKAIPVPDLISEFAEKAPGDVQDAVRLTVAQLLGSMPTEVAALTRATTGQNIASLMFSMQMTGYMFRNAQYRKGLLESLESSEGSENDVGSPKLPAVTGTIAVEMAPGLTAEVNAAAYMAELRSEVEGLRTQLIEAKQQQADAKAGSSLIQYVSSLQPEEAKDLSTTISKDVLEAMGQLIENILRDADVQPDAVMEASDTKLKELLVWQLITGYKLRELEVKEEIKDKFWGS